MRKLAWAAFSFAAAIFVCHYVVPSEMRLCMMIPLLIIAVCSIFFRGKLRAYVLLICLCSAVGILRYDVHAKEYLGIVNSLQGNDYRITAYVAEYPVIYDDYSKITVYLRTDMLPEVKTVLYDYDHQADYLVPGDMIRTTVKFSSAAMVSGEEIDTYISKGIYLRGTIKDEIKQYGTWWGKFLFLPLYVAREIQQIFDTYVSDRASAFMKALITGEKTALYENPEINLSLQKAGLSHVVAVSGMHISILISMIMVLFGNRSGRAASVILVGIFAVMTGMSPSVLRAAFMQMLYLLAPILRRESDGMTSVGFALLILLWINPFAAASVSLQLSFAAVIGILIITPKALDRFAKKGSGLKGVLNKIYSFVVSSLAATLGASFFTIPLCAIYFGSIAVFAPIANLFVLWIVPICFSLGFALCLISQVSSTLAHLIGQILSLMVEFIYGIADLIADISFSTVYLPVGMMIFWVISAYAIIFIAYLWRRDSLFKPIVPICFAVGLLGVLLTGVKVHYQTGTTVAAIDVGQGQCVVLLDDDETILIDCGGTYTPGQNVLNWLSERGREDVDCIILTHFDKDHTNGIIDLMMQMDVKEIMFCTLNLTENEYEIINEIKKYIEIADTDLTLVNQTSKYSRGDIDLNIYVPNNPEGNNGLMVLASVGEFDLLVTGDADMAHESELMRWFPLPDGECLVVGHHGSKYSTSEALLDRFKPEFSFISCGYNQYGHPTEEVLDRLNDRNVVIYRTDILGSIEVKVR